MSTDWLRDVWDFHRKFGCGSEHMPISVSPKMMGLRKRLHREEVLDELEAAMDKSDLVGIADGIADSIYVLLGTAVVYGIDIRPVWDAVHAANMAKTGGATREDGKIMKPSGWEAPDVEGVLRKQKSLILTMASTTLNYEQSFMVSRAIKALRDARCTDTSQCLEDAFAGVLQETP